MSLKMILAAQREWARRRRLHAEDDYASSLEANLFMPLNARTRAEFMAADGNELGSEGRRGKMLSLRSSSALAVNFFDHWRDRPLAPLAAALGTDGEFAELVFEQKFPHGIKGIPPNIDVVLMTSAGAPFAIESKFAEPYRGDKPYPPLDEKYFVGGKRLWADAGLPKCQEAAEAVGHKLQFSKLDAGQLLKHLLGMSRACLATRPLRLAYLWYDAASHEAATHRREIETFAMAIDGDAEFTRSSYQEVFARVKPAADLKYIEYLQERYFAV